MPENAKVLAPIELHNEQEDLLLAITKAGRMLIFPVADLPQLSKGKGIKLSIYAGAQAATGDDLLTWLMICLWGHQ